MMIDVLSVLHLVDVEVHVHLVRAERSKGKGDARFISVSKDPRKAGIG